MKKIITLVMALLMTASLLAVGVGAESYSPVGGWAESEQGPVTVKKADPADVVKDGVIGEYEYEKIEFDLTEDSSPLHVMYKTSENLTDGLEMLATCEFYFSWDEVHGFNFALKNKPKELKQVLSEGEGEKPGDDFANNLAYIVEFATEKGIAKILAGEDVLDADHRCVYYAVAKRTDDGRYLRGWYDENQLGLRGDYAAEAGTDFIINYTDDGYSLVEWSMPYSYLSTDPIAAGEKLYASFTLTCGGMDEGGEYFKDNYCVGLGDHCFMIDAKIGAAGSHVEFDLSNETIKPAAENPFKDVTDADYFFDPVMWAVENKVTAGTGANTFSPNDTCTRAQVVTFLWRAKGSPEPNSSENPFVDVKADDYFYKAVLWAKENNITSGTDATHFSPDDGCTRAQVVTFLWRTEGEPDAGSAENPFADVGSEYYTSAVLWAVAQNITKGTDTTHFSPNDTCTRGQIVTFLYRDLAK